MCSLVNNNTHPRTDKQCNLTLQRLLATVQDDYQRRVLRWVSDYVIYESLETTDVLSPSLLTVLHTSYTTHKTLTPDLPLRRRFFFWKVQTLKEGVPTFYSSMTPVLSRLLCHYVPIPPRPLYHYGPCTSTTPVPLRSLHLHDPCVTKTLYHYDPCTSTTLVSPRPLYAPVKSPYYYDSLSHCYSVSLQPLYTTTRPLYHYDPCTTDIHVY